MRADTITDVDTSGCDESADGCDLMTLNEFSDFQRLDFVLTNKDGNKVRIVADRCGGDECRAIVTKDGAELLNRAMIDAPRQKVVEERMAAHLAGVTAALTSSPVIGVPLESGGMGGMDSLLSTVQMPGGMPVATVAVGKAGAKNAAILAAQMLGLAHPEIADRVKDMRAKQTAGVPDFPE